MRAVGERDLPEEICMVGLSQRTPFVVSWTVRSGAVLLCLAVAAIHVIDQRGFPGSKEPGYVGIGYYLLEAAGIVAAILLLRSGSQKGWLLAAGVALGPLVGYVLSRGPGLPNYTDDVGNWTEPVGLVSLIMESVLLVLALSVLRSTHNRAR
jgi:hypothetical protein